MNHFFKNIRILDPETDTDTRVDLWLKEGLINHCSNEETQIDSNTEIIEGENLVCCPGLFDMRVHLREPGYEYKESIRSGCSAAANGGITGVACLPNTDPIIDEATSVNYIKQKANDLLTDVKITATITKGARGDLLSPMLELNEDGVVYFTDGNESVMNSEIMRRAFEYASGLDLLLAQHCRDHYLTDNATMNEGMYSSKLGLKGYPSIAEEIILSRDVMISEYCGNRRYHASHISTSGSVRIIRDAKERGLRISCETTPMHFSLTEDELTSYSPLLKINPPLRSKVDKESILDGIKDGTIDCIVSDHSPHATHETDVEYELAPFGVSGLETLLGISMTNLVHAGHIDLKKLIELLSTNPRRILKLEQIKLSKGEKANLTIFDPEKEWEVDTHKFKSKAFNTPFAGKKLKGKPIFSINNNKIHSCDL